MFKKIKIKFNTFFWKYVYKDGTNLKLVGEQPSSPFIDGKNRDQLSGFEADYLREWNNVAMDGFCYKLEGDSIIEPSFAYTIVKFNKIIRASSTFPALLPATGKYLNYRFFNKGKNVHVNAAVLFDGKLGVHYFHFFADVINKLWLLDFYGIDNNTPLIISRKTFESNHFQYLLKKSLANRFKWLIQEENEFIRCKNLFLIKPAPFDKPLWDKTLDLLNNLKSNKEPFRRIFVTRPTANARGLRNALAIEKILKQNEFEFIEPGVLSFEEQARIFSEAKFIVALDGSALTNLMFTYPEKVRVLNVGALYSVTNQFYWMALMLNIKYYNCIFGTQLVDSKFEIPIHTFEPALAELLSV